MPFVVKEGTYIDPSEPAMPAPPKASVASASELVSVMEKVTMPTDQEMVEAMACDAPTFWLIKEEAFDEHDFLKLSFKDRFVSMPRCTPPRRHQASQKDELDHAHVLMMREVIDILQDSYHTISEQFEESVVILGQHVKVYTLFTL